MPKCQKVFFTCSNVVMENVLHWRRKLLDFDHPINPQNKHYIPMDIPRYYSSFYPWFQPFWQTNNCNQGCKDNCVPTYRETIDYPPVYNMNPSPKFKVNWLLYVVILYMLYLTVFNK